MGFKGIMGVRIPNDQSWHKVETSTNRKLLYGDIACRLIIQLSQRMELQENQGLKVQGLRFSTLGLGLSMSTWCKKPGLWALSASRFMTNACC